MLTRARGLLLDLGDTVLIQKRVDVAAGRARVLEHARLPAGVSAADYHRVADEISAELAAQRGAGELEFSVLAFQRLVSARLGVRFELPELDVTRAFLSGYMHPEPSAHVCELLDAADAQGCALAIVSNTVFPGVLIEELIARSGLGGRFRFVMTSADYGLRKPNRQLLLAAAARLGLAPAEIWFAGDRPSRDVAGANRAGMVSVYYDRGGGERPDPACAEQRADVTVHDWRELIPLLSRA